MNIFKSVVTTLVTVFTFTAPVAFAQVGQFNDSAKVVSVTQVMQQSAQVDCYQPAQQAQQIQQGERSYTGGALGGLAGALLGAQVGQGNGRIAASAVGTLLGALAGDRVDNRTNAQAGMVNATCNTGGSRYQSGGFLVTYEYNGRQGQKRMPYDPGQSIRVTVTVDPQ